MCLNLFEPILNVAKCAFFSAIVDEDDPHGALIVCLCDCSEALLARCVPNLQLDSLFLHIDGFDLEVDSYIQPIPNDVIECK
jgi:hypothetical protein